MTKGVGGTGPCTSESISRPNAAFGRARWSSALPPAWSSASPLPSPAHHHLLVLQGRLGLAALWSLKTFRAPCCPPLGIRFKLSPRLRRSFLFWPQPLSSVSLCAPLPCAPAPQTLCSLKTLSLLRPRALPHALCGGLSSSCRVW